MIELYFSVSGYDIVISRRLCLPLACIRSLYFGGNFAVILILILKSKYVAVIFQRRYNYADFLFLLR